MALPKIDKPIFEFVIPSTKKKVKCRPMLVKEEKILLMAKESNENTDILNSIKQVVNNCIVDKINIDALSIFDLEYLFIKLRAISINNVISVTYKDNEDEQEYKFDIDLNTVEVKFPENINKKIELSESAGIILKYPDASLYTDTFFEDKTETELFEFLFANCIEKIYDGDTEYLTKDYSKDEVTAFLEDLDIKSMEKFREFTANLPKIEYVIEYKNSLGNDRKIVLSALNDFFTLG